MTTLPDPRFVTSEISGYLEESSKNADPPIQVLVIDMWNAAKVVASFQSDKLRPSPTAKQRVRDSARELAERLNCDPSDDRHATYARRSVPCECDACRQLRNVHKGGR